MMSSSFDTLNAALNAGFDLIDRSNPNVKDTSGPNSFGYAYTEYDENGNVVRRSVNVWLRKARNKGGKAGAVRIMWPPS